MRHAPLTSALLLLTASPLRTQQTTPPLRRRDPNTVTITATARNVVLDVVVIDPDGHPVTNLTRQDFTLLEDDAPQTINSFQPHTSDSAPPPSLPKLPPNAFTNVTPVANTNGSTVILLDALDTSVQTQMYLRGQVIAFMKTVPPGTTIAIFQLDTEMHLLQGFTSDPATLLQAVDSKRDMPSMTPLRNGPYPYQILRGQILSEGLQNMARYLAGFPGRKNLVWFSGGVAPTGVGTGPGSPFGDTHTYDNISASLGQATSVLTLSRIAVYPVDARGVEPNYAFSAANRNVNAINTPQPNRLYDHELLDDVAEATGGHAYYGNNDLKHILTQITDTGSNYYTIAYAPTNEDWHGQYRKIKLSMTSTRGYTLLYRHGYYATVDAPLHAPLSTIKSGAYIPPAPTNPQIANVAAAAHEGMPEAMSLGAIPPTELLFDVSIAPGTSVIHLQKNEPVPPNNYLREDYLKKPFRNYHLLFAVDPSRLLFTQTSDHKYHAQLEYVAVLYNDKGESLNSVVSVSTMNFDEPTYRRVLQTGLGVAEDIAIPEKGNFFLRLGLHDPVNDRIGALELPVASILPGVAGPGQKLAP